MIDFPKGACNSIASMHSAIVKKTKSIRDGSFVSRPLVGVSICITASIKSR